MTVSKKNFISQLVFAGAVRVLGAGLGFLMSLVIARGMSSNESGLFFLGFAVCSVLGNLSTLGMPTAFVRFIGAYSAESNWGVVNGVFVKGVKAVLMGSLITTFFLIYGSAFLSEEVFNKPDLTIVLKVFAFSIPSFALYTIVGSAFQGRGSPKIAVCIKNICSQFLVVIFVFFATLYGLDLTARDVAEVLAYSMFITCLVALVAWYLKKETQGVPDYTQTSGLIASAKPLWIVILMTTLVQWSGQLISGMYVSPNEVAYLSVAQRTAALISFVLVVVNLVIAPRFAAISKQKNRQELRDISLFCSRLMLVIATPVFFVMFLFSEYFMALFGVDYRGGSYLLKILAVGQFINVLTGSVGFLLNMSGNEREMRKVVFLSGFLAVFLSVILVPSYGVVGAAIATSVALGGQNLLAVYKVKQRLGFNMLKIY